MLKSLWLKFLLLLLAVSLIALSAALMVRELLVTDFREYLEGEMEDRVYWVTAALESSFEQTPGWDRNRLTENAIWSLMLGFEIRLYDTDGDLVMDTDTALDTLGPLTRKRLLAISEQRHLSAGSRYLPYTLFLGGTEIGRLDVRFLRPQKERIFIGRANRLLLLSLLTLGGLALVLSVVFSRRLTRPIEGLTTAAQAIERGDLSRRVRISGQDEISKLAEAFNRMARTLHIQESLRKKLTSNIAHELRTPLTIIRGELEAMMDALIPLDREHLQSLHAEIVRMRKIIEGLEDLSQAEASVLNLNLQPVTLRAFLQNMLERFNTIARERGITIGIRCDEGLSLRADPDKLSQIVINLVSNALKAVADHGHIWIDAARENSAVTIRITDDGCGIRENDLPHVFERFFRASEGGLGLGLAIVKELVEAHGATIDVKSEYGKGSSFTVTFPH